MNKEKFLSHLDFEIENLENYLKKDGLPGKTITRCNGKLYQLQELKNLTEKGFFDEN